jgi:hypothetical protein
LTAFETAPRALGQESFMVKRIDIVRSFAIVATLAAAYAIPTTAVAQKDSATAQAIAAQQNQTALAPNQTPQPLLVPHADKGGNIARPRQQSVDTPNPPGSNQGAALNTQPNSLPRPASSLGK